LTYIELNRAKPQNRTTGNVIVAMATLTSQ